jgi:hypothetical protein
LGKPFTPDDPRINRAGRPKKGESYTDLIRAMGDADFTAEDGAVVSSKQALVERLFALALKSDFSAIKYIIDRIDGSPRQSVDVSGGFLPISEEFNMTPEEEKQFEDFMQTFRKEPEPDTVKKPARKKKPKALLDADKQVDL